jgi:glucuronoarabinoxylan endo-1,4-beta-xylanase
MNIIQKATPALTAATVLAVCTAMTAIAATTGDLNKDGVIDSFDLILCRKNLITMFSGGQADMLDDIDGNDSIQINDLVLLQKYVLGSIKEFPQTTNTTTTITTTMTSSPDTTTTTVNSGGSYMNKMTADIHLHEDTAVTEKRTALTTEKLRRRHIILKTLSVKKISIFCFHLDMTTTRNIR